MTLKILGGQFKGRLLKTPKGDRTRPTSALVRKAFFDIFRQEIEDARFLDLYAGSGAMGLEALSRGAASVTLVDTDGSAIQCITENIETLGLKQSTRVFRSDAFKAAKKLISANQQFDLIYLDPPYGTPLKELLELIDQSNLIRSKGLLIIEERSPSLAKSFPFQTLTHLSERKFGDTLIEIFTKEPVAKLPDPGKSMILG